MPEDETVVKKEAALGHSILSVFPVHVAPPACACKGNAPQMREHTTSWCSTVTTEELDAILAEDES